MADHVVVGYVTSGWNRDELTAWLLAVCRRSAGVRVDDFLPIRSGPNVSEARNQMAAQFLAKHDAPWLFMVDTDMVFSVDVLDRLIAAADPDERPIVGALYFGLDGSGTAQPQMYSFLGDSDGSGQPGFICYRCGPDEGCVQVDATGAGALLVHRDALEKVRVSAGDAAAPWFRQSVQGGALFGEDLTFCLRARDAGIPVHVHTGVRAGHMKTTMLGEVT